MTPAEMLRQPSFYVIYLMMTDAGVRRFGGYRTTQSDGLLLPRGQSHRRVRHDTALVLAITVDRI